MEYDADDEIDDDTVFAEEGERCISPEQFDDFVSRSLLETQL